MLRIDLKKNERDLYVARRDRVRIIDVPEQRFLMLDGVGSPSTSHDFQDAIGALYAVAARLRLAWRERGRDYVLMPLEALWWWGNAPIVERPPEHEWRWTLMIRLPEPVTELELRDAERACAETHPLDLLGRMRVESLREGVCAQTLHVGPYKDELPSIERLHGAIARGGYAPHGKHHEIYLGDPRRARPDRLRTLLRQPVRALSSAITPRPANGAH